MRAVTIPRFGGPEVLEVADVDVREAREGEIRIRVTAAAVNPTDVGMRAGATAAMLERAGLQPPYIPGMDAAGAVESVGPGAGRLAVGDVVMAIVMPRRPEGGAQAELIVVPEASAVPIPAGVPVEEAATLPMNGLTARRALDLLALAPGDSLAITGAAGVLGTYATVLAKEDGLRVIADAKPEDEAAVREAGADVVVARGDDVAERVREHAPDGVDAVLDTALLGHAVLPAIRDGGGMAVVRGWDDSDPGRGITVHPVMVAAYVEHTPGLEQLRDLAAAGRLRGRVAGTVAPERAGEAHERMDAGGLRGRVLITF